MIFTDEIRHGLVVSIHVTLPFLIQARGASKCVSQTHMPHSLALLACLVIAIESCNPGQLKTEQGRSGCLQPAQAAGMVLSLASHTVAAQLWFQGFVRSGRSRQDE